MICGFCKESVLRLNVDGYCRKCGPIIRYSLKYFRRRQRVMSRFVGPPTFKQYCAGLRVRAWREVREAVRRGQLAPVRDAGACVDCGDDAYAYEHRDYERPLEVEPVCARCNSRRWIASPHPRLSA